MYFTTLNVPKTCKGIINLTSKSPNELEKKKKLSPSVPSMKPHRKQCLSLPSVNKHDFFTIWCFKLLITYHILRIPSVAQALTCCYAKNCWKLEFFNCFIITDFTEPSWACIRAGPVGTHTPAPGPTWLFCPLWGLHYMVKTSNRSKMRPFCVNKRERSKGQVRMPSWGANIMSRDAQSQDTREAEAHSQITELGHWAETTQLHPHQKNRW